MKKADGGYSLVEVLLSLFFLTLILTGTLQLLAQATTAKMKADTLVSMATLLSNRLEELRRLPLSSSQAQEEHEEQIKGDQRHTFICRWRLIPESVEAWRIEIEISPQSQPEKRVEATLWIIPSLGF